MTDKLSVRLSRELVHANKIGDSGYCGQRVRLVAIGGGDG